MHDDWCAGRTDYSRCIDFSEWYKKQTIGSGNQTLLQTTRDVCSLAFYFSFRGFPSSRAEEFTGPRCECWKLASKSITRIRIAPKLAKRSRSPFIVSAWDEKTLVPCLMNWTTDISAIFCVRVWALRFVVHAKTCPIWLVTWTAEFPKFGGFNFKIPEGKLAKQS